MRAAEFQWHAVTNEAEEYLRGMWSQKGAAEFLQHSVTNEAAEFLHQPFMWSVEMHWAEEQTTLFNQNY